MRKVCLLLLVCSCSFARVAGQTDCPDRLINWGIKVGFNSAIPDTELKTEYGILTSKTINKVGYTIESFMRINMKRFYLQPEIAYCLTRESIHIQKEDYSDFAIFNVHVKSFDASAICGYNTVKEEQYGLSLFAGCKIKYAYQIDVSPIGAPKYTDEEAFYNIYITTGLGVNISRFFFDFRYDIALMENDIMVNNLLSAGYGKINLNRRANILGFSIGVLF